MVTDNTNGVSKNIEVEKESENFYSGGSSEGLCLGPECCFVSFV